MLLLKTEDRLFFDRGNHMSKFDELLKDKKSEEVYLKLMK